MSNPALARGAAKAQIKKLKDRISLAFLCFAALAVPESGDSTRFVDHPRANEIGTRHQVKHATLSTHQVKQRGTVHFFKILEIEQYPQLACARSLNQLIQIRKMTLK